MSKKLLGLAAAMTLALSGAAFAQQPAGGGSATGNMNNPGSVKSNTQKMEERNGTGMTTGTTTGAAGAATVPGTGTARPGVGMGGNTASPAR
ncbi:hypothetical protein Q8W71_05370 [Methylobacterium sp. NEAU 140]|uniref:hypothetical protein n=1 Tax=Methylobacterium sp. NEAU 140 TaxID=3064945 RepID=UPI002734E5D1|nr:hypothetical protein [Methylobacterium sp. NEAU 140]MDP4022042.1 hypothetical protein [Methylobacterium sp. NEAU 140]